MTNRKQKKVTLRDIAERVGVSAMTVSRALSGKSDLVNIETAKRCCEAATQMGYFPNLMARSLRGEQLKTIVMFAEFISRHHYLAELVDVVSRSIEQRGYGVITCQSIASLRQAIGNFQLAGSIVIAPPEEFYDIAASNAAATSFHPCTVLIHSAVEQKRFHEVSPDIVAFNYNAASHLLELGHKHIGYIGGLRAKDELHWFDLRRRGIEQALKEHDLPPVNLRHQPCSDTDAGPVAVQQLLSHAPQTTAVMCINDEIAISVIAGAKRQGIKIPQELSVVGCNDIRLARYFEPSLTTFSIDIQSMVDAALNLLFDELGDDPLKQSHHPISIKLPANLTVRNSTAPPPSA